MNDEIGQISFVEMEGARMRVNCPGGGAIVRTIPLRNYDSSGATGDLSKYSVRTGHVIPPLLEEDKSWGYFFGIKLV